MRQRLNQALLKDKMTEIYGLRELDWDTELFGVKMGEIIINSVNDHGGFAEDIWRNTINAARRQSYLFLLYQVDTRYQETAELLIRQGATIGDTLVTLELNLNGSPEIAVTALESASSALQVAEAVPGDLAEICTIAANSFIYSRFFQDHRFDATKARRFYPKWLRDSFGTSERVFILKDKTQTPEPVLGFISLQDHEAKRETVIRLLAVEAIYRGYGYGQVLMDWLIRDTIKRGFLRIQVGTQANNLAALHLYEKNGFQPTMAKYRFHLWLDALSI